MSAITLYHGDCLEVMRGMADNSVDLIVTDPPYFRVKGEAWDRQWDSADGFLEWVRLLVDEWQRILRPNGSLYVFASPKMAARVECRVAERFNVLNNIRWQKEEGWHRKANKDAIRSYLSPWEAIIFAEHDNRLGRFITSVRSLAGLRGTDIDIALGYVRTKDPTRGTELCRRWEEGSAIPSYADFERIVQVCRLPISSPDAWSQYVSLVRPFSVSADVPYTDVWDFPTVQAYPGKHVCEKPAALIRHIIRASSRPGAVVFDGFMGSGVVGEVCVEEGHDFIGCDKDAWWFKRAQQRIEAARLAPRQLELIA